LAASWPVLAGASGALRPLPTTRANYGESWTFIADLDDGTYVQLSLGFTNIGPGGVKGLCRALVIAPAGAVWRASTRVGKDGWSWTHAGGERLSIGPCAAWLEQGGTGVEIPLEGGAVRLTLGAQPTRRSSPDATVATGDDLYRTEILLFRAPVGGSITIPGAPARPVTGAGYLDHSRSTIRPKDLAERWVRFRALRGERGALLLGRRAHDGRFTPVWACEAPGRCRSYASFSMERGGEPKAPTFKIALPSEAEPLRIESSRLLYRDAPIEDLGLIGKIVAPFFGSPVTYVYRASLSGHGPSRLDGILEVELSGE
jgi:hypothetical protein